MKRLLPLCLCLVLAACSGVPIRSLPRLAQLPQVLLDAEPAEFVVALQVDARLVPPPGAVPLLVLKLVPREPAAFEPLDKQLPLQVATASAAPGLATAPQGRRWLIYTMPPATQAELRRVQDIIKQARSAPQGKGGGSLSVGVSQESLATTDPVLSQTRWDTWLQARRSDGFFEVWSGSLAQLRNIK